MSQPTAIPVGIATDPASTEREAARLGALPDAALAMPRQVLERAPARGPLLPRLIGLFAQRLGA
ncbi:hypothetical protein [Limimaricola pyoseonensis]|uniref:Uncharacterized protein n=1 Tax=Limimaricola pyoseonensis TaxID=521013 RepID=A0A1G7H4B9_9RHOB|nr:hypothetical protein [Limimaricola pyoseonensis]SDE95124.1 hypothetical protein SAMN04488567_3067 [Limimaricola pyoseonensis]